MGCWDIYCILCGNTCHEMFEDKNKILEAIKLYENNKKNNWFKKSFKPIYDAYNKNPNQYLEKINILSKSTNWLKDCTFLTATNKIIHNVEEVNCNIMFVDDNNNNYIHSPFKFEALDNYGLFVHTDCWKFIQKKYKIDLCYSHLPIIDKNLFRSFIKYPLGKYLEQDFNFKLLVADNKEDMAISPFKSSSTAKNISNVFTKLKIRISGERKGPLISASFYKNGEYKVGSNGNIWVINNKKWTELKDTIKKSIKVKLDNKTTKFLLNTPHCGDKNNKPIFILNYKFNKNIVEIDFILTSKVNINL